MVVKSTWKNWLPYFEVEAVVNTQPLTYLDDDISNEVLTPAHLLYGRKILFVSILRKGRHTS